MIRPDIHLNTRVHMIGISGAGVSGLAVVLAKMGFKVSGSDLRTGPASEKLKSLGIRVFEGHDGGNVAGADLVVASAAVPDDNLEAIAANEQGIPIWSRAKMLGFLMSGNLGVAIAGTHGKTTATSMLAVALESAGLDPTVLVGGDVEMLNGNAKVGDSDLFVAEACEAFNSFQELRPRIAVVTNIEAEHLDYYGSLEGVIESFRRFLSQIDDNGCAIMCIDCPNVRKILPSIERRVITYGLSEDADCRAYEVEAGIPEPVFQLELCGRRLGEFQLRMPGVHNIQNALSAIAVGSELGADPEAMREGLSEFRGAGRRFEILGTARGITIVDDYAHHPTEVRATLLAARTWGRRIVAVFQPHLYSRTQLMADDFTKSLELADLVFVTEIYAAREEPIPGVSASMISDLIESRSPGKARFVPDKERLVDELFPILEQGDLVVVMGAGDIRSVGEALLARLR